MEYLHMIMKKLRLIATFMFIISLLTACSSTIPLERVDTAASDTEQMPLPGTQPTEPDTRQESTSTSDTSAPNPPEDEPVGTVVHEPRTDFFIGTAAEDAERTHILSNNGLLLNDTYMFTNTSHQGISKINLETFEFTPVCRDPFCKHNNMVYLSDLKDACMLGPIYQMGFLYENKVYYIRSYIVDTDTEGSAEYHDVFSSYDYTTGEYHAIQDSMIPYNKELMKKQMRVTPVHEIYQSIGTYIVYGSYAYSIQYRPIAGGGDTLSDYRRTLVRLDLSTDKTEDLMVIDGVLPESASILTILNRTIYLLTNDTLYAWSPERGTIRTIVTIDAAHQRWYRKWYDAMRDGYWYTVIDNYPDGFAQKNTMDSAFVRIDLRTGEIERMTSACPNMTFIVGDAFYLLLRQGFWQIDERWKADASPWQYSGDQHLMYLSAVVKIDMDGGQEELLGYCYPGSWAYATPEGIVWMDEALPGCSRIFEFATGLTRSESGEILDDPKKYSRTPPPAGI